VVNLCFDYFAAAQAGRADADALGCTLYPGPHGAQVDVPAPARHVMGVADGVAELRLLAADITNLCHGLLQMNSDLEVQTIDFIGVEALPQPCQPEAILLAGPSVMTSAYGWLKGF